MGGALLAGWLARDAWAGPIAVVDPKPNPRVTALAETHEMRLVAEAGDLDIAPALVVAAVKPAILQTALGAARDAFDDETAVVSVAAGVRLDTIEAVVGARPVIRAMPNTPAAVGRGMTVCAGNDAARRDEALVGAVTALFEAVGRCAWVSEEAALDAVTAVSGSGPAYVFHMAECLAAAGRSAGLPADLAEELAVATVAGAGEMLWRGEDAPATLRENVTSPNGTTAAALEVLTAQEALARLMRDAVAAAKKRAEDLGAS
jgi:pyrroline-5-carboxylate reductase